MDRAGLVILFVPEASVRTEITVAGQKVSIFRQQAIIDAFCASSKGWPLQWYCHPQLQYWHRGACQIGNNASGPQPVLQPYVVLHLVSDPKDNAKNKLKRWSPLRCTVGKGVTGYTNCMEVPMPATEYLKNMHSSSQEYLRPVQKPIRLYRELMRLYSEVDAVVMEFPCGTAPASIAGYMEQRHVLCIDMDEAVLASAKGRYEEIKAKDIDMKKALLTEMPPGAVLAAENAEVVMQDVTEQVSQEPPTETNADLTEDEMRDFFTVDELARIGNINVV